MAKTSYKINKGFITQKVGASITIFDGEKSALHTFNSTASSIFENIKRGLSKEQAINDLIKTHKIDAGTAKKDFEEFIQELKSKKIIG